MSRHTCKPDPIIGKCPCQMNVVEWRDWEPRARAEFYRDRARKAEAERDWNIRSSRLAKEERIKANARAEKAEARIRDLTQEVRDERGAALDALEQIRVRDARIAEEKRLRMEATAAATKAEARIKAVQDVLDGWQVGGYDALLRRIRRALDGDAQQ